MDLDVASKHFPKFKESLPEVSGKVFAITGTWKGLTSIVLWVFFFPND